MKKKRSAKQKEGYTPKEMRAHTIKLIDESMKRLRLRLRAERKRQERTGRVRGIRHEVAV